MRHWRSITICNVTLVLIKTKIHDSKFQLPSAKSTRYSIWVRMRITGANAWRNVGGVREIDPYHVNLKSKVRSSCVTPAYMLHEE